jgi:acetylornithine/N-succinyldiaminopimelate aminotransferase
VRGQGLMLGLKVSVPPAEFSAALRAERLLSIPAGDNVVRILPPLIVTLEEIGEGVRRIEAAAAKLASARRSGQLRSTAAE